LLSSSSSSSLTLLAEYERITERSQSLNSIKNFHQAHQQLVRSTIEPCLESSLNTSVPCGSGGVSSPSAAVDSWCFLGFGDNSLRLSLPGHAQTRMSMVCLPITWPLQMRPYPHYTNFCSHNCDHIVVLWPKMTPVPVKK
jgi:hypothetical protein